ncbi:MAG: hypothetical protein ACAH10_06715 [Methylophilaceae bacterium]
MLAVYDGDYITEDLRKLPQNHADLIEAFLQELIDDERALTTLLRRDAVNHCPDFNSKVIEFLLRAGYNLARISPKGGILGRYRIIYAIDNQHDDFYLLAIVEKNFTDTYTEAKYNYEPNHPITTRICAEYEHSRIPYV